MNKIKSILFIIFAVCSFSLSQNHLQANLTENFQDIISYSKEARTNILNDSKNEKNRIKKILEEVYQELPKLHYNEHSELRNAVENFMVETKFFETSFKIIDSKQTDVAGKSSDQVYMIFDQNNVLVYVLKAFKNPRDTSSKFLPEISSLDKINELGISNVIPIMPLAAGIYEDTQQEWGLLLETAAKGQRSDQYIFKIKDLAQDSLERTNQLRILEKMMNRIGESFAALHSIKSKKAYPISFSKISSYDEIVNKILSNDFIVNELSKYISLSDFVLFTQNIKEKALKISVFSSYWHGDAHLGNLIYDAEQDHLSFIDVAKMHSSIGLFEEPLGDGNIDVIRIEESFLKKSLGIMTPEEIDHLLQIYYQAYDRVAKQTSSEELRLCYSTFSKLKKLLENSDYINESDLTKKAKNKLVFDVALSFFKGIKIN